MVSSWVRFDRYMLTVNKSGCSCFKKQTKWSGKCMLDNSRRKYNCWEGCPKCKPLFKDRLKTAWHILTWNRRYIRQ